MSTIGNNVEIIRLKVAPGNIENFLAARKLVDKEVSVIDGFLSTEVCRLDEENWVIFIKWENSEKTNAAQKITETMKSITDWISIAKQFVSFETVEIKYTSTDRK